MIFVFSIFQPEKLKLFADRINFELELDPHELKATIESDQVDENGNVIIQKRVINHDPAITPREPYVNSKIFYSP